MHVGGDFYIGLKPFTSAAISDNLHKSQLSIDGDINKIHLCLWKWKYSYIIKSEGIYSKYSASTVLLPHHTALQRSNNQSGVDVWI